MCPACVAGAVFLAQIFAVWRWFRRAVLKNPVPDDEDYWNPVCMLSPRMQAIASDKRKLAALFAVITLEVIAAVVLLKIGGFQFIRHWLMKLK